MTNVKKLGAAFVLVCTVGLTVFADCPLPGQMDTPPCIPAQAVLNDSIAPGQMGTPSAVSEIALVELPSLAEIALNVLTLF